MRPSIDTIVDTIVDTGDVCNPVIGILCIVDPFGPPPLASLLARAL
ncbi:MAG: hypothetical protein ISN28_01015 [Ectothiorhodospiraceae bacterium AqS1]|nr:hypothetical protein [Ectothiorhodospiraceae bacterium AqS1]